MHEAIGQYRVCAHDQNCVGHAWTQSFHRSECGKCLTTIRRPAIHPYNWTQRTIVSPCDTAIECCTIRDRIPLRYYRTSGTTNRQRALLQITVGVQDELTKG